MAWAKHARFVVSSRACVAKLRSLRLQYPLINKEYALNHTRDPTIIQGAFSN